MVRGRLHTIAWLRGTVLTVSFVNHYKYFFTLTLNILFASWLTINFLKCAIPSSSSRYKAKYTNTEKERDVQLYSCCLISTTSTKVIIHMFIKSKEMEWVTTNTHKLTRINISVTTKGGLTNFSIICIDNNLMKSNENNY